MKRTLKGKVVCITGASRGMGRAIAEIAAQEKAHLVLGSRTSPDLDEVAGRLGAIAVQTDVRKVLEVERLIEATVAEFGRLDIVVNAAGVASFGPMEATSEADFDEMFETTVKGTFFSSQAALRVMKTQGEGRKGHGLIVNLAAAPGRFSPTAQAAWASSQAAVLAMTHALAAEAAWHGVRVTALRPEAVDTDLWKTQDFLPFPENVDPNRDFLPPEAVARAFLEVALLDEVLTLPEVWVRPLLPTSEVG